jgi:dienelactone hydrolase
VRKLSFLILTFLFVSIVQGIDGIASTPVTAEHLARSFVSLIIQQQFEKATACFDEDMKGAVPPHQLKAIWIDQLNRLGTCQRIESTRTEFAWQYRIVFVTCQFNKQRMDIKVVVDKVDKITGLFFVPEYRPPAYAKLSLFRESDAVVGEGEWTLPGTLSIPVGKGPFPAVVLVHGSGPNDRDESIGPNKPFRDLAWGLASRGIVVLRYVKRTKQYAARMAASERFTVKEETIEDALSAVSLLQKTERVDKNRVFILGHSLGGMLGPRICSGHTGIAGLVVMAGNTRPLEDLLLEQNLYQASLAGELSAAAESRLEEIKRQVAAVKKLSREAPHKGLLLQVPASYWLDLQDYDPANVATTLKQPMLILQGENDCQVNSKSDFERWRQALSDRTNVVLKSYPALNHLFMEVSSRSTGEEYQQVGSVAEVVVSDITAWIKQH